MSWIELPSESDLLEWQIQARNGGISISNGSPCF